MAGICSAHMGNKPVPGCPACHTRIQDALPDYEAKVAEAKAAGLTKCPGCGFEHYLTSDICPKCNRWVTCIHCGKDIREHNAKTRQCPAGKRSRIGFIQYGPETFQGPRSKKA
jgi:hypothetical protein